MTADQVLKKLRKACAGFPDVTETLTFGHPAFQIQRKTFAVLEEYKGELSICINVGKAMHAVFVSDPRFYSTPYSGKHGWVSLKVHAAPLDWDEISELLRGSYELTVSKRSK